MKRRTMKGAPKEGPKDDGVKLVRPKKVVASVAGILGWSSLVIPDEYQGKKRFKARIHLNDEQIERMGQIIETSCVSLFETLKKEATDKINLVRLSGAEWVARQMKEPGEKSSIQLPYLEMHRNAEYEDRKTKEIKKDRLQARDREDKLLDLPALKVGMKSIVQLLFEPGLYFSALTKVTKVAKDKDHEAAPCPRLLGLRIIKLEQFGGGSRAPDAIDNEDLVGVDLGDADDLSAYVTGAKAAAEPETVDDPVGDLPI